MSRMLSAAISMALSILGVPDGSIEHGTSRPVIDRSSIRSTDCGFMMSILILSPVLAAVCVVMRKISADENEISPLSGVKSL